MTVLGIGPSLDAVDFEFAPTTPPPIERVPFDFDGDDTLLERIMPWFRRQRRR